MIAQTNPNCLSLSLVYKLYSVIFGRRRWEKPPKTQKIDEPHEAATVHTECHRLYLCRRHTEDQVV